MIWKIHKYIHLVNKTSHFSYKKTQAFQGSYSNLGHSRWSPASGVGSCSFKSSLVRIKLARYLPWNLTRNAPENRPKPPKGTLKVVAPNEQIRCELLVSGRGNWWMWFQIFAMTWCPTVFYRFFTFDYPTIPLLVLDFSHQQYHCHATSILYDTTMPYTPKV